MKTIAIVGITPDGMWTACVPYHADMRGKGKTKEEAIAVMVESVAHCYLGAINMTPMREIVEINIPELTVHDVMGR